MDVVQHSGFVHFDDIIIFPFDPGIDAFIEIRIIVPSDISRIIKHSLDDILMCKKSVFEQEESSVDKRKYDEDDPDDFYRKKTNSDFNLFLV